MGVYQLRILEFPENVILQQSANLLRKGVFKAVHVCPVCVSRVCAIRSADGLMQWGYH